jgi:hypothetical protein
MAALFAAMVVVAVAADEPEASARVSVVVAVAVVVTPPLLDLEARQTPMGVRNPAAAGLR